MARCMKCGYELSSLPLPCTCPECGLLAEHRLLAGPELALARVGLLCLLVGLPAQAIIEIGGGITPQTFRGTPAAVWLYSAAATLLGALVLFCTTSERPKLARWIVIIALIGLAAAIEQTAEDATQGVSGDYHTFMRWPHFAISWSRAIVFGPLVMTIAGLGLAALSRKSGEYGLAWIYRWRRVWLCVGVVWLLAILVAYNANEQVGLNVRMRAKGPFSGAPMAPAPSWFAIAMDAIYWSAIAKALCIVGSGVVLWMQSILLLGVLAMRRKTA